jgi:hypothetical protein
LNVTGGPKFFLFNSNKEVSDVVPRSIQLISSLFKNSKKSTSKPYRSEYKLFNRMGRAAGKIENISKLKTSDAGCIAFINNKFMLEKKYIYNAISDIQHGEDVLYSKYSKNIRN